MKKLLISALFILVGSCLFTSCTSVPQDRTAPSSTSTTSSRTYSK